MKGKLFELKETQTELRYNRLEIERLRLRLDQWERFEAQKPPQGASDSGFSPVSTRILFFKKKDSLPGSKASFSPV